MTTAEISACIAMAVAIGGALGWLGKGVWGAATAQRDLEQCQADIAKLALDRAADRAAIVADLKASLTEAIKLAIKEMEVDIARRDGSTSRELGEVKQQVASLEKDVENLFGRLRDVEKKVP